MINLPSFSTAGVSKLEKSEGGVKAAKLAPSILGIVVCLIIIAMVVWPKFNEVVRLRAENEKLKERAGMMSVKSQILSGLSYDLLEEQFIKAERILPSDKAVFSMISRIERSAIETGMILDKIDLVPGAIKGEDPSSGQIGGTNVPTGVQGGDLGLVGSDIPRLLIKVSIIGDYRATLAFLNSLDLSVRLVSITDLSIARSDSTSGGLRSSMTVNAFWKPLPQELPSLESPVEEISDVQAKILESSKAPIEASGSSNVIVPQVPIGRTDLFATF